MSKRVFSIAFMAMALVVGYTSTASAQFGYSNQNRGCTTRPTYGYGNYGNFGNHGNYGYHHYGTDFGYNVYRPPVVVPPRICAPVVPYRVPYTTSFGGFSSGHQGFSGSVPFGGAYGSGGFPAGGSFGGSGFSMWYNR